MSPDAGVVGVLLAGGQSRRMGGGDKCLQPLAGRPILAHIVERVSPQVERLILNANGDPARFAAFDMPVVADEIAGHAGPLAGVLTGMAWAVTNAPEARYVATFPTDAPFLPADLVSRLYEAVETAHADMACAASDGRNHPVVGLWPVALRDDLRRAMIDEEIRKVDAWTARHRLVSVTFACEPVDPFFNTNRPEDLATAEALIGRVASI
jgi:molybdopterin-guanine dinucleotide biosynthesis protein A